MKLLQDRIIKEGTILPGDIVKVDSFLNHQIDPILLRELGKELTIRFANQGVTMILTIEASGIAIALMTGLELNVPVVFAKKVKSSNISSTFYSTTVYSYTKNIEYGIYVSKDYLSKNDRVLIIDDFLATGHAVLGLINIVRQSYAGLVGVGIAIEKGFQGGGKLLREQGIRVESLANIKALQNGQIIFNN